MMDAFETAMELLLRDVPSRDDVVRASQLLEAASAGGHAEASERCALIEAFGMARPQNWDSALDYLALSARQGSRSAQEQLILLSDNMRDPVIPEDADDSFWATIRASVRIDQRIEAGEKQSL